METRRTLPGGQPTLTPLPLGPLPRNRHAYGWTSGIVGGVGIAAFAFVIFAEFFSVPIIDPTVPVVYTILYTVMFLLPSTLVIMLSAWGALFCYRAAGARGLPGFVQGLMASVTVFAVVAFILWILLFTGRPPE